MIKFISGRYETKDNLEVNWGEIINSGTNFFGGITKYRGNQHEKKQVELYQS